MNERERILTIVNPRSSRGRRAGLGFVKKLMRADVRFSIKQTTAQGSAADIVRKALDNPDLEGIVVISGDGTQNEAIQPLVGTSRFFLPIAGGRANSFMRNPPIECRVKKQILALKKGVNTAIDVGIINKTQYFLNTCGVGGFDAKVACEANRLRRQIEKWFFWHEITSLIAYLYSALKHFWHFEEGHYKIWLDYQPPFEGKFFVVTIMNGRSAGDIFKLAPQAKINDGWLDVCLVAKMGQLKKFLCLVLMIFGWHKILKEVKIVRCRLVEILSSQKPLMLQFDGETTTINQNRVIIAVKPAALLIRTLKKSSA